MFRTRSTTTRDRDLQFRGAVSTGLFFDFLQRISLFFQVRNSPQNVEKLARFLGGEKKRRILSCLWLSWFFWSWDVDFGESVIKICNATPPITPNCLAEIFPQFPWMCDEKRWFWLHAKHVFGFNFPCKGISLHQSQANITSQKMFWI